MLGATWRRQGSMGTSCLFQPQKIFLHTQIYVLKCKDFHCIRVQSKSRGKTQQRSTSETVGQLIPCHVPYEMQLLFEKTFADILGYSCAFKPRQHAPLTGAATSCVQGVPGLYGLHRIFSWEHHCVLFLRIVLCCTKWTWLNTSGRTIWLTCL